MILKTKEFQEACKNILVAVDNGKANLELIVRGDALYLNVTNREYYVSIKFALEQPEDFKAVIEAQLFLNLIAGITTDTFELKTKDNTVVVKSGKSSYKLAMIFENDKLAELPPIYTNNKSVEMTISKEILYSILNSNSKELVKIKKATDVNELQKLYYIDENGCFTFSTGATLNGFSLEQPVKMLLNDRIVKLFKLFKDDVHFSLGHDAISGLNSSAVCTKAIFETDTVYLAAIITNDDILLNKVQGPCAATKRFIDDNYPIKAVLSASTLSAALARLMQFSKNSNTKVESTGIQATVTVSAEDITFTDNCDNSEVVEIEAGSIIGGGYDFKLLLNDLKLVVDSCKEGEHVTLNCGNYKAIVINHGTISNLIPENTRDNG